MLYSQKILWDHVNLAVRNELPVTLLTVETHTLVLMAPPLLTSLNHVLAGCNILYAQRRIAQLLYTVALNVYMQIMQTESLLMDRIQLAGRITHFSVFYNIDITVMIIERHFSFSAGSVGTVLVPALVSAF